MIWLTFLGAGLVLRYGGHIGIDTLQDSFPRQAPLLRLVIFVFLLGFFAFMVWIGTRYASLTWNQTTPVMQIPVGVVYLAMPVGFALLIIHLLLMARPYVARRQFLVDAEFDPESVKL
jgi:TRAP-type C4-dicarboxylate transport system permease small subunit